ncbi:autotransporter assembly complex protein TamA [Paracoccus aerodenitrificans]|uniref:autotransporter assembly complex protein TamA n=1 Tax=Paracoccus aerodenitrificans TaxID=3017781 RepID=UPI0022F0C905|nr:autotransporter assembly complex family protein [Paracoccus aerodenitrificans]WBU63843.1 autotransporter assembly complex protein TamA [Paracoccus aerodenitrificans]
MQRTLPAAVMTVMAASIIAAEAPAQSASSSNPFAGISRLFDRGEQPVTDEDGQVLGPPVKLDVLIVDGDEDLERPIRNASLVASALAEDRSTGQDILAAARGDYARVLGVLFDEGYFSAIINITLDGVEAAEIAPLDGPEYVGNVVVAVDPGPRFKFGQADLGPLAPGTNAIESYAVGKTAGTGIIKRATSNAISNWRDASHAKARVAGQEIIADHNVARIESRVDLNPGPAVTFGRLHATGNERLNTRRMLKIAGYPEGEAFDPEKLETVRKRLRRSGVFSAITLVEAETLNPDNSMDVALTVVEQKLRRVGAAFELSNVDGAMFSAYWLHRNLLGGGERFRIEGEVSDIKADSDARDYDMDIRLERPATLSPDTTGYIDLSFSEENEPEYYKKSAEFGLGFSYIRSERLTAHTEIQYTYSRVNYGSGYYDYSTISLPTGFTWDRRDDMNNAKRGFWLEGEVTPFVGLKDTGSGVQLEGEGRIYHSMLTDDRLTFAARGRAGTVLGPDILEIPPDYLFFSGGGGSVRGQPYESLGFDVPLEGTDEDAYVGGQSLVNISLEARYQVRNNIGAVVFVDAGKIWDDGAFQGDTKWHGGAGVGMRYNTPIGPIRFDVATPIEGKEDDSKVQLYLGLGQAF